MIGDTATRVLLAVVNQRRPTVRSVAEEVGCAISTAYVALRKLDAHGLVVFEKGKQGALRSNVRLIDPNICSGYNESGDQHRANGTGPLDTTAPSKRRDHARG